MNFFGKIDRLNILKQSNFIDQIIQIDQLNMQYFWDKKKWFDSLADENYHCYYLQLTETLKVTSFCLIHAPAVDDVGHLLKIATAQNVKRSGQAQALLENVIGQLLEIDKRSIYLEVATNNLAALKFYKKNNFSTLGTARRFYSDGQDAYKMQLLLAP